MLDPAAFAAPASPINTSHCQTTSRWRKAHTTDRASGIRPQPKAMHRVSTLGNANRLSGPRPRAGRILVHISVSIGRRRSEEHTSELQSLMRISYAVFCLKKKRGDPAAIEHKLAGVYAARAEIYELLERKTP